MVGDFGRKGLLFVIADYFIDCNFAIISSHAALLAIAFAPSSLAFPTIDKYFIIGVPSRLGAAFNNLSTLFRHSPLSL